MIPPEEWKPHGIENLEDAARRTLAAASAAVIAGPGAGKTEFLAQRAAFLLETGKCAAPQRILAISFKKDAARNLSERLKERVPEQIDRFASMTFDAFTKSLVDRFRNLLPPAWKLTAEYEMSFPKRGDVKEFLDEIGRTAPGDFRHDIRQLNAGKFLSDILGPVALRAVPQSPTNGCKYAISEWWGKYYLRDGAPVVDFIMLNRLAELIVRSNPQLQRALRATYPYLFIDEFQDTTYAQYTFLKSVFPKASTTVTVVGDGKQRIMGWAGALPNAFAEFAADYTDTRFELERNYRSRQELVDLQLRFAQRLDAAVRPQVSHVVSGDIGIEPVQAWDFSTATLEAQTVAAWIVADIENSGRRPSQYALIARQKVAKLQPALVAAFAAVGRSIRNDDASVGKLKLGDILKDDLVELLLGLVRLGASRGGQPEAWRRVTTTLARIRPEDSARQVGSRLDDELSDFLTSLRRWFAATPLGRTVSQDVAAGNEATAQELADELSRFLRLDEAANRRVFSDRAEDIDVRFEAFTVRLAWALGKVDTWPEVADAFLEDDAVPLMTIHRSKGLEYHTVFVIGLDGDQWWAHTKDTAESTMTFFVGMSRAAERLFFTSCDRRGGRSKVADLYRELEAGGVQSVRWERRRLGVEVGQ
ncbi:MULTISPECIES: UvrD-helicase domain-containing protein [Gordonia]|uniref:UvrD-helicase domain-containing protein n=1 Tax=Gordonia TaxID=2053 RepID=UPI0019A5A563|nr:MULTISPECIES: ATP-dependent helicase [Gordonia]MBD0022537.1 ATP-dependent helicase [Gordonia sp. (in: high G+C Gram-positive bacteria)]